jgi:hypothetical protein
MLESCDNQTSSAAVALYLFSGDLRQKQIFYSFRSHCEKGDGAATRLPTKATAVMLITNSLRHR